MSDAETLKTLLSGLCKTSDDQVVLEELTAGLVECDVDLDTDEDGLVIFEEMDFEFSAPTSEPPRHPEVPESFHAISKVFGAVWWDAGGPEAGWALAEDGSSDADDSLFYDLKDDYPDEFGEIEAAGGPTPAFMAGQNAMFFDPTRKLANGEPALAFVSHEGGGWELVESVHDLDYGQILLRLLADNMVETQHIPEVYF